MTNAQCHRAPAHLENSGKPPAPPSGMLPPAVLGCRYEGEFLGMAYTYTDLEQGSPAYGGTFAVPIGEATPERALAARDRQRAQFAGATA